MLRANQLFPKDASDKTLQKENLHLLSENLCPLNGHW